MTGPDSNFIHEKHPLPVVGAITSSGLFVVYFMDIFDSGLPQVWAGILTIAASLSTALWAKNYFGYDGLFGILISLANWVSIGIVASVVFGTLLFPLVGTLLAPVFFIYGLATDPTLSLIGLTSALSIHFLAKALRRTPSLPKKPILRKLLAQIAWPILIFGVVAVPFFNRF